MESDAPPQDPVAAEGKENESAALMAENSPSEETDAQQQDTIQGIVDKAPDQAASEWTEPLQDSGIFEEEIVEDDDEIIEEVVEESYSEEIILDDDELVGPITEAASPQLEGIAEETSDVMQEEEKTDLEPQPVVEEMQEESVSVPITVSEPSEPEPVQVETVREDSTNTGADTVLTAAEPATQMSQDVPVSTPVDLDDEIVEEPDLETETPVQEAPVSEPQPEVPMSPGVASKASISSASGAPATPPVQRATQSEQKTPPVFRGSPKNPPVTQTPKKTMSPNQVPVMAGDQPSAKPPVVHSRRPKAAKPKAAPKPVPSATAEEKKEEVGDTGSDGAVADNRDLEIGVPPTTGPKTKDEEQERARTADDDDDDDNSARYYFFACIGVILIVLAIVLPIVLTNRGGSEPRGPVTLPPSPSPDLMTPAPTPVTITNAPTRMADVWVQSIPAVFGPRGSAYGSSLALAGNYFAAGAPKESDSTGAVYTFVYSEPHWTKQPEIPGDEAGDEFGAAIDILDEQLVVGAPFKPIPETPVPGGAVYYYVHNMETDAWDQVGDVIRGGSDVLQANEEFGAAVAVGRTADNVPRLVVGAPRSNRDLSGLETGRVYTFQNEGTWETFEAAPLFGKNSFDLFGTAVDMAHNGSRFIVGAPGGEKGYFQVYVRQDDGWVVETEMEGTEGEALGASVVFMSGDRYIAVGGPGYQGGKGVVRVYRRESDGSYAQVGPSIVGASGDRFGDQRMLSGDEDDEGLIVILASATGDVRTYAYEGAEDRWIQKLEKLETSVGGARVEYSPEDGLLVGNPGDEKVMLFGDETVSLSGPLDPLHIMSHAPTVAPGMEPPPTLVSVDDGTRDQPADNNGTSDEDPPSDGDSAGDDGSNGDPPSDGDSAGDDGSDSGGSGSDGDVVDGGLIWTPTAGPFLPNAEDSEFGSAMSLSPDVLVIGAPAALSGDGAVFLYEKREGRWDSIASGRLFGDNTDGRFGESLDMASDLLVVGSPKTVADGTPTPIGSAHVYTSASGSWEPLGSVLRGDTGIFGTDEMFGYSSAIVGSSRLIVGAPGSGQDFVLERGRFYIFDFSEADEDWSLSFDTAGPAGGSKLGSAVDMKDDGSSVVVGAPGGNGYVEVFDFDGSEWSVSATIEGELDEQFGTSVVFLSSNHIAVGAPGYMGDQGRIVVYTIETDGTHSQMGPAVVGAPGDLLGSRNSLTWASDGLSFAVATAQGVITRYDYGTDGTWTRVGDSVNAGSVFSALTSSPSSGDIVIGADNDVILYELLQ